MQVRQVALAALLAALSVDTAAAQTAPADREVRLLLDPERHRLRRVRTVLQRTPRGPLESPVLGDDLLRTLLERAWAVQWPGLDSAQSRGPWAAGDTTAPERAVAGGVRYLRREWPSQQATVWSRPDDATPVWTVSQAAQAGRVGMIRMPAFVPLLPDHLVVDVHDVTWIVHHDAAGDTAWQVGLGRTRPGDLLWQTYVRAPVARDAPADLDAALSAIPAALVRHARARYRPTQPWHPSDALLATVRTLRYNRVEGGSIALPVSIPVTATARAEAWIRFSTSSYPATGGASVTIDRWPASWGVRVRRSLEDANLWEPALVPGNSISALLFGQDDGHYYTATGAVAWAERAHGSATWRIELFSERHRTALPRTDWALFPRPDTTDPALTAESGDFHGVRGYAERQWGLDLENGVVVARFWTTAAGGGREWVDLGATLDVARSRGRWAFAGRVGAGGILGHAPIQREYHLGGVTSVRGFLPASAQGPVMVLGRVEMGYGPPAVRAVLFSDVAWAGEADSLDRIGAIGLGLSLAGGILRLDLAHPVLGGRGLRFHFSGNGLL